MLSTHAREAGRRWVARGAIGALVLGALTWVTAGPAAAESVTDVAVPTANSAPLEITKGPDGAMWFTEHDANKIGRITTAGTITEFDIPTANSQPSGITAGPDGNLYFAEYNAKQIARITTSGTITEMPVQFDSGDTHVSAQNPDYLTAGPDGNLYLTDPGLGDIWLVTTSGSAIPFVVPRDVPCPACKPSGFVTPEPFQITTGPDGNLWFTISNENRIGRMTTSGTVTQFTVSLSGSVPAGITTGPDGALWFTLNVGGEIGRITTSGAVSGILKIPNEAPDDIVKDPRGVVWVTMPGNVYTGPQNLIGRIDPNGGFATVAAGPSGSQPIGIAVGPSDADDTALFFTENAANQIGKIFADQPISASGTDVSAVQDQGFTGTVAKFFDPDFAANASNFSASIDWGDGSSPSSGSITGGPTCTLTCPNGNFTVSGSHTYATEGTYTVTVTITENEEEQGINFPAATTTATATVTDAPISASGASVHAIEDQSFTGTVTTFTDPDTSASAGDYTAVIDWGDGTTPVAGSGSVSGSSGRFTISGSHTYSRQGTFTTKTTIYDVDNASNVKTVNGTATVADAPISASGSAVAATEGQAFTGTVATFTDPDTSASGGEYTAVIDWGDGTPASSGNVSGSGGSFTVSGSHVYADEGTDTVKVTITDADNASSTATASATASVGDAALGATGVNRPVPQSFTGTVATFSDANPSAPASDFTAMIDWGDGSAPAPGTVSGTAGSYSVNGTHSYATTGPETVKVTIADDGGASASAASQFLIYGTAQGGNFVVGDRNAAVGTNVTFWGSQWSKLNKLSHGTAPSAFKGFETTPPRATCGTTWNTGTGNSPPPPAGPLPNYMLVVVTSTVTTSGSTISGDTVHLVVVKVNPGYGPDPSQAGTGSVVAVVC